MKDRDRVKLAIAAQGRDRVKLATAAHLLNDDHLVWSADFEAIREPLAKLLNQAATSVARNPVIVEIADKLLIEEYDLTI